VVDSLAVASYCSNLFFVTATSKPIMTVVFPEWENVLNNDTTASTRMEPFEGIHGRKMIMSFFICLSTVVLVSVDNTAGLCKL